MSPGVFTGQVLIVGSATGIRVRDAKVVDSDGIRGNSADESIQYNAYADVFSTGFRSNDTREVETRVTFRDGPQYQELRLWLLLLDHQTIPAAVLDMRSTPTN